MRSTARSGTWARWGWLVTTLALGAWVIASAGANYRSAERAAESLVRARAQLYRDLMLGMDHGEPGPRRSGLDSLVAAQAEAGLRFVGWVWSDGEVSTSGGEPNARPLKPPSPGSHQMELVRLGPRVRVYFPPPGPPSGTTAPPGPPPPPDRPSPSGRAGPPTLVIEFEPIVARDLVARAFRSLLIAGIVAAVLMAAGIGFWRISQHIEQNQRRMEEQRRLLALGEMSAVLAHEIRNPLASLKGHAQLLTERLPEGAAERRKAHRVVEEATRLEALTTDLLDFARSGPLDLRAVAPAAVLRAVAAELPDPPIEIDATAAPSHWLLDERRFGRSVLGNLLRNAVLAVPAGRPPEARVGLEDGNLVFTIRDFGPGLPTGSEARVFDPFFTTRAAGTGLGLAVARRIVELHGGHLEAANAPGGGAVFRIELPRREG